MQLFDHLVGAAEQRKREGDAQRLGRLEVDDQLDFHHLVNRQVGRFGALENSPRVAADQPIGVGKVGARDKTSGEPVTTFRRSTRLYRIAMSYNRGLDRDKDGIACEKA